MEMSMDDELLPITVITVYNVSKVTYGTDCRTAE
jgi:hypothetical protein